MKYYIGSVKIEMAEDIYEGYITLEDFGYAIQRMLEDNLLQEEDLYAYNEDVDSDWYLNLTFSEKQAPDVNGNTHSLFIEPPYKGKRKEQEVEEPKEFGASPTATPTDEEIEEGKKRAQEKQDEVDINDIPF